MLSPLTLLHTQNIFQKTDINTTKGKLFIVAYVHPSYIVLVLRLQTVCYLVVILKPFLKKNRAIVFNERNLLR